MRLIYSPPLLCIREAMLANVAGILVNYLGYMVRKILKSPSWPLSVLIHLYFMFSSGC